MLGPAYEEALNNAAKASARSTRTPAWHFPQSFEYSSVRRLGRDPRAPARRRPTTATPTTSSLSQRVRDAGGRFQDARLSRPRPRAPR
ncbi:MAG: hypothetical protein MZU91_06875 [Desulfosudis oleivorans]|nr:hypothetical protein [Desulfosudis oleivorans]